MTENIEQKPEQETLETPAAEPDFEKLIKIEDFKPSILLTFKQPYQGDLFRLEVEGEAKDVPKLKKPGPHDVTSIGGRLTTIDGNDILIPQLIPPAEKRKRAIEEARHHYRQEQAQKGKDIIVKYPNNKTVALPAGTKIIRGAFAE